MAGKKIIKAEKYKVKDGDTIESLAKSLGITWQELAKFNWGTDVPSEINKFLRAVVGCTKKTQDGNNYIFTSKDDPGIIYLPKEFPKKKYKTSAEHVIVVEPPQTKVFTPADCCVKFRPKKDWNGEYGFDWMREKDFPIQIKASSSSPAKSIFGNLKFEDIMGYYMVRNKGFCISVKEFFYKIFKYFGMKNPVVWKIQPNGNEYTGDRPFDKKPEMFKRLEGEYKKTNIELAKKGEKKYKEFYVSYLNIYGDKDKFKFPRKVNIQAFVDVHKQPDDLYLKFEKDYFDVEPASLPKSTEKKEVKITCKKPLDSDQTIEAHSVFRDEEGNSHDIVVGKLEIPANSGTHSRTVEILCVKITTPAISPLSGVKTANAESNFPFVEKVLHQSLIHPNIKSIELNFNTDKNRQDFIDNYVDAANDVMLYKGKKNAGKYIDSYCMDKLISSQADFNTKYGNHLIAFYFPLKNDRLNGYSRGTKVVMFENAVESTAVHEWLHSLDLRHTFDGKGKFTYEYAKTVNVMDYTHHKYETARMCLYHWQWLIVKSSSLTKKAEEK